MTRPGNETVPQYNWNDIPSRVQRPGVIQRVFRGNDVLIGYAELHPEMKPNPHSHDFEQIFMLLKGRVKLHIGDQVYDMVEGSVVRIPANAVHWADPPRPEDGVAINMDIWAPLRPDYVALTAYQTDEFDTK